MKSSLFGRIALVVFVLLLAATGCKKSLPPAGASSDTILIGEVGSMTGAEATFGISTHQGIELALKQINATGGVKGKKLQLVSLDDQGKAEEAATAVTKLITQNQVAAIIGEVASGRSLAMAPIAQAHRVPMITPSSVNPKVTEQGDYIFRVCFIDSFQGDVMARFAMDTLNAKKVAILRDVKNEYSVGLAEAFAEVFKKKGGEILIDQGYSGGDVDFKSQLTSIRGKNPEAIFVPGYYTEIGLIARQARELGIRAPLLGGDGWDSPKLTEIGGEALNGSYFATHFSADDRSLPVRAFIHQYQKIYGTTPDGIAATAFDATRVLAEAMNRAKSLSSSDIRDAIATTRDFSGVTGRISIDAKRNAIKPAVVIQVENSKQKFSTTVQP